MILSIEGIQELRDIARCLLVRGATASVDERKGLEFAAMKISEFISNYETIPAPPPVPSTPLPPDSEGGE